MAKSSIAQADHSDANFDAGSLLDETKVVRAIAIALCGVGTDLPGSDANQPAAAKAQNLRDHPDFQNFESLPLPGGSEINQPSATADTQSPRAGDGEAALNTTAALPRRAGVKRNQNKQRKPNK